MQRIFSVLVIILLISLLWGCQEHDNNTLTESTFGAVNESISNTSETTTAPTEPTTQPVTESEPIVFDYYDTMGYCLTLPASWGDRIAVWQEENIVTVEIDAEPIFSVISAANAPGVRDLAEQWKQQGYSYHCQTYEYVFYRKLMGTVPPELSTGFSPALPNLSQAEKDFYGIFSCDCEKERYSVYQDPFLRVKQSLGTTNYDNHLLGIGVRLPEGWQEYLTVTAWDNRMFLSLKDDPTFLVASVFAQSGEDSSPWRNPVFLGEYDGAYYYANAYIDPPENAWETHQKYLVQYPFLSEVEAMLSDGLFVFLQED